jgi:hypothetical protein
LLDGEGVGEVSDFADRVIMKQNLDDVETEARWACAESTEVGQGRERETSALARGDGSGGAGPVGTGAGFDFDEGERVVFAVAEDEVDFAALGFEVGGEEFEALFLEVMFGGAFAELTAHEVGGEVFGVKAIF